jgi:starch phosphorylase
VGLRVLDLPQREVSQGSALKLRVAGFLNGLQPADVRVEFVARRQLPEADFEPPLLSSYREKSQDGLWRAALEPTGEVDSDGSFVFALEARPPECGQFATEVRVFPRHELLSHPYELGLMKWL